VQEGEPLQEESPRRFHALLIRAPVLHTIVGVSPVINSNVCLDMNHFSVKIITNTLATGKDKQYGRLGGSS